ncbi:MAG: DUF4190 domain-containing protein [Solirubrobacteraceae bacterium]
MTEDEQPGFDPPQTPTPGPPPGAPPTPPPPTKQPAPPAQAPAPPGEDSPSPPAYAASPRPSPYGYAQAPAAQRTSGKAVAALVLGIAGWLVAPFILSVLGIVFGTLARKEIAANPSLGGRGMANWGFWLSITGLAAWVVLIAVLVATSGSSTS